MQGELLCIENLRAGYGARQIIRGVDLSIYPGEFVALLGLNGSGKTTLLRSACGLMKSQSDRCQVYDEKAAAAVDYLSLNEYQRARLIAYIPQRHSAIYNTSVLDVVLMGFNPYLRLLESPGAGQKRQAAAALAYMGLEGRIEDDYLSLSEGQKQLVILARCLVQDAPVMMMDEPDSALDFVNRHMMLSRIRQLLSDKHRCGLITLHDPNFAMAYCDRLLLLRDGEVADRIEMSGVKREELRQRLALIYGDIDILEHKGRFAMVRA